MDKNLNSQQQKAVDHVEGPLLVLAGAGSGKTRVVTHRIARLINLGIPASDILAVTFTNKAAEEMRNRVRALTNARVLSLTFHSLGAKILKESIDALGFQKDFSIYDEEDVTKVIKACLINLDVKPEKETIKTIRSAISSYKNALLEPNQIKIEGNDKKDQELIAKTYDLYQTRLKEFNACDFDDLLFLTVKLFKEHPHIKEQFQNRWQFLLIDEYQDTNVSQYTITKMLGEKHKNIFVVGDPDQSIYSWRGAKYQNILNFDKDFEGAQIIYLEQNYRSTNNILKASNAVISFNSNRYEKNLWSDLEDGEKIRFNHLENDHAEARFVIDQVISHQRAGVPLDQMVVFYRTNAQSRHFEDALLSKNIPYKVIGGLSFYQRKEIKDLLAFLKMLHSDHDFISFSRTINLPKRGVGQTTIQKIQEAVEREKKPIFLLCQEIISNKNSSILTGRQKEALKDYVDAILELRPLVGKIPLNELILTTLSKTRYFDHLKEDPETFEDRKENIDALITKAAEFSQSEDNLTLLDFLEELSLKSSIEDKGYVSCVNLMTVHHGKGLEFPIVFVTGLEEELFPHSNSKYNLESLEEERRLFYVAITRARSLLYLTSARTRFMWGHLNDMVCSRFIKEIPKEYLHNKSFEGDEETTMDFLPGDQVVHKDFGVGTVEKAYSTSFGKTYDVLFENDLSSRSLVAKYAKLKAYKAPFFTSSFN